MASLLASLARSSFAVLPGGLDICRNVHGAPRLFPPPRKNDQSKSSIIFKATVGGIGCQTYPSRNLLKNFHFNQSRP